MSTQQNPTYERTTLTVGATVYYPPFRAIVVDAAGTVTIQNTDREAAPVIVPVAAGVPIAHQFDKITAVSGPTVIVGCR